MSEIMLALNSCGGLRSILLVGQQLLLLVLGQGNRFPWEYYSDVVVYSAPPPFTKRFLFVRALWFLVLPFTSGHL